MNNELYSDPTAEEAICKADAETWDKIDIRRRKLVRAILNIAELSGFSIEGRIVLRDKESGKVWR